MPDLREAGISKQQLLAVWDTNGDTGFTPVQLLAAGITSAEMLAAGITVAQMQASEITLAQIHAGGVSPAQLLTAGITSAEMLAAGITVAQMQAGGITLAQIHAGGVSITQLLGTGLSITQLRTGGVPDYALFNEACNTPLSIGSPPGPVIRLLSTNLSPTNTQVILEGRGSGSIRWEISGISGFATFFGSTINTSKMLGDATAVLIRIEEFYVSTLSLPFDYVFSNLTVTVTDGPVRSTSIQLCPGR